MSDVCSWAQWRENVSNLSLTRIRKITADTVQMRGQISVAKQVQNVDTFIFRMPQFWNLVGRVKGLNLGNGRFQFEFQTEEDLEPAADAKEELGSAKKFEDRCFKTLRSNLQWRLLALHRLQQLRTWEP